MNLTPSLGRITGRVFNPLLDKYEDISYNVGGLTCKRLNNQLNSSLTPTLQPRYDPLKDSYNTFLSKHGTYPVHFKEVNK